MFVWNMPCNSCNAVTVGRIRVDNSCVEVSLELLQHADVLLHKFLPLCSFAFVQMNCDVHTFRSVDRCGLAPYSALLLKHRCAAEK